MAEPNGAVRVMHVVCELQPGGMEFGVVKLVNGLDAHHVRSAICSTRPAGTLKGLLQPGIPVYEFRRREGNDPRLVWQLYRLFRRERPDIVHTHAWGTLIEGLVAARLARVPVVIHGEHGTLQLRPYQRWVQRRAWSKIDRVLSVSSRLAERMSRETGFPVDRIETIRNGVDVQRFGRVTRADARLVLGLAADDTVIGTVGRLVPVKDHASLLTALQLLQRQDLRPTLVIAGDGPLRDSLVQRARELGVEAQVRLLGHRPDVETVLAALDLFVLPSASEGMPNSVLEAMAAHLPVVATRVGGADEVVEGDVTGVLVPPGSPERLAEALAALLGNPDRRHAMGTAARERAEAEFALDTMVRRYEMLYMHLARGTASDNMRTI